jgi:hypothetical protein
LLVRHLVGQPITRLEIGVDDAETADEYHGEQAEQPGTADHAYRDPVTEGAQRVDPGVPGRELGGKDLFVAHQQDPEHRNQRQHRKQRDDGGGKAGFAKRPD